MSKKPVEHLKTGDVVRLKHGGPWMTVTGLGLGYQLDSDVETSWFDEHSKLRCSRFVESSLEKRTD